MTRQPDLVHITKHADDDFNENGYIASVADRRRHDPVLHFEQQFLANELIHNGGATGIAVADVLKTFQFRADLYFGVTSPQAKSEAPHWHTEQWEAYAIIEGGAEIVAKYRWVANGWITETLRAGDVILVQLDDCHWFRWRSSSGLCYVFKAPQVPGVGPAPAGKVTCDKGCPHNTNGCIYPTGWRLAKE